MTLAEYDALMTGWSEAHAKDGDEIPGPDPEFVMAEMERLKNSPAITGAAPTA